MPSLGGAEIIVILLVALLVFGPQRLPELSRQLGEAIRELRRVQHDVQSELRDALDVRGMVSSTGGPVAGASSPDTGTEVAYTIDAPDDTDTVPNSGVPDTAEHPPVPGPIDPPASSGSFD